ncbi:hypothetical protein ACERII_24035 [Evansella sp. AB-rgal1]|uniref:hypothetical protein n=1 Tax=Evansella sp. AB-rgal1 TaxID=3242696 RepID=UPI00359CEAB4
MLANGTIDQFSNYSQFTSLDELNLHMRAWIKGNPDIFSKSELIGLYRLTRYCAKVLGVSNVKIGTILKGISEEFSGNGISRSTFKRMIVKAKDIGLLKVLELKRQHSGGQSSNLYVIQRHPNWAESVVKKQQSIEPPSHEKLNPHKTKQKLKTNNNNKKEQKRKETLDHTYTSDRVPVAFTTLVKNYFDCAKTIEELWRMAEIAAYKQSFNEPTDSIVPFAITSFKQTVRAIKNKPIHKPVAFFYRIISHKFSKAFYDELVEMGCTFSGERISLFLSPSKI